MVASGLLLVEVEVNRLSLSPLRGLRLVIPRKRYSECSYVVLRDRQRTCRKDSDRPKRPWAHRNTGSSFRLRIPPCGGAASMPLEKAVHRLLDHPCKLEP